MYKIHLSECVVFFFFFLLSHVLTLYLVPIKVEDGAVRKEGKRRFVDAVRKTCRGW